jgi:hypothetical protein
MWDKICSYFRDGFGVNLQNNVKEEEFKMSFSQMVTNKG